MKVKIQDHEELVRDTVNQAVLNKDLTSLEAYRARRAMQWQKDAELREIKEEISELKELLHQLVKEKT